jgi:peroxiredoxin
MPIQKGRTKIPLFLIHEILSSDFPLLQCHSVPFYGDRTFQTLGNALVGRCSEPAQSDKVIWQCGDRELSGILAFYMDHAMRTLTQLFILLSIVFFAACGKQPNTETSNQQASADTVAAAPAAKPAKNELPELTVNLLNGTPVNLRTLKGKVILILYQPDCDHCQRESTALREHIEALQPYEVYFISAATAQESEAFAAAYKFKDQMNIHFALTPVEKIISTFGPISAPSLYVYSEDHALVKHFDGETPVEEILKVL